MTWEQDRVYCFRRWMPKYYPGIKVTQFTAGELVNDLYQLYWHKKKQEYALMYWYIQFPDYAMKNWLWLPTGYERVFFECEEHENEIIKYYPGIANRKLLAYNTSDIPLYIKGTRLLFRK